ncbi:polyketide synthase [Westerdykella ornata]|uniref:Polyketide synthase n=1 Tax=Westerdykella ornata TaxID=318751 RepID=A0A6A6JB21_WESOR|nr:polyketide synthase [Westerdykella ornata]KAF2273801.1 polyketide synthase [Westerdykella ornata]
MHTVLYFGDQTDGWVEGIDQLHRQAATTPWLKDFFDDVLRVVKEESQGMDDVLTDSLGDYSSLFDLADRYRYSPDEVGMARAVLLHVVRAAMLLQWVKREPQLVSETGVKPERLGVSGGLTNLAALAISTDLASLYGAVLEVARVFVRLCRFTSVQSRAMEDRPGVWGCAVLGIKPDELRKVLEQFQESMGIPPIKRAKVGVTGDRWSTVIGPPSVIELVFSQCPSLRDLPKNDLSIHALQHIVTVSQADLDYIVGNSDKLKTPVIPNFKIWGMDDPEATYSSWGDLLRAVVFQVLSLPLDITKVMGQLNSCLTSLHVSVKVIGPSSHTAYLASVLKSTGRSVTFHTDKLLENEHPPSAGRVAIVGMAGRGPGSDNVEDFWNVIMSKQDLSEEIPGDRFDLKEFYCDEHKDTCTTTTRFGCFMNKPGHFDSRFFHVSPREALLMDPGHRQFLMSAYEALEVAGYSDGKTKAISPKRIATFYGQSNDDWHMVSHHTLGCDAYTLQGAQRAFGAGRIAFNFKWEGPTYSLDSACASSTSAIHLACMSLLTKDIDMAVVGAANIVGYPHSWTSLSKSGVLSDTGNCKTFRDDADGYCRADFVGSVVLKRLEDAVAQNDNILAVVASSGRNHSGNSTSITTSDAGAQESLFRRIMHTARVSPDDISYVEMHGTGTQIGDPAEMGAVVNVFKQRQAHTPLTLGGVKANVGHSEAAAGMASLLKCIMMFQKDILPPQAGMPHTLNPRYPDLSEVGIDIPSEPKPFTSVGQKPRRILLNNFDAAGGNASLILEDYLSPVKEAVDPRPTHVVAISARTPKSYHANKVNLLGWLRTHEDARIEDIAYTTTARRMHHSIRFACAASTVQELIKTLESDTSSATPSRPSSMVFVFTGQASHYPGMGGDLYTTCPPFRKTVDLCASICKEHGFPFFEAIITDKNSEITEDDTTAIQLAIVTLEVSLAAFWKSCGITPALVMGHSLGEYAALHVAGVLSLADMLYLVGHRARLLSERCESGACAMLAVGMSPDAVRQLLETQPHSSCTISCANSPYATVVSGTVDDIAELRTILTCPSKTLAVPYGFHSFQMDPMLDDYISLARGVTYSAPKIPVSSTLLASIVDKPGTFNAPYLGQQTRQPVDFVGSVKAVTDVLDDPIWLEIGPSPVCTSFIRATISPPTDKILSTLDGKSEAWTSISKCLAGMYKNGVAVDWIALHGPYTAGLNLLTLPSYAWELKDFWITYTEGEAKLKTVGPVNTSGAPISTCAQYVAQESSTPPDLMVKLRAPIASPGFDALISGHRIRGVPIVPGSVFCEAGLAAAKYALQSRKGRRLADIRLALRSVTLKRPLTRQLVGSDGELLTAVHVNDSSEDIKVSWEASSQCSLHELGSGIVSITDPQELQAKWDPISYFVRGRMHELINKVKEGQGHRLLPDIMYALFSSTVGYAPAFKCVKEAFISSNFEEAAAEVILRPNPQDTHFVASPYWGESLVHLAGFLVNGNPHRLADKTTLMMDSFGAFEQTVDFQPGRSYFTYVRVSKREKSTIYCDVYVFDTEKLIMQCSALRFHEVNNDILDRLLGNTKTQPDNRDSSKMSSSTALKQLTTIPRDNGEASRASSQPLMTKPTQRSQVETVERAKANNATPEAFQVMLESISKGTGSNISELTDETQLIELGVDSIMGIEIAARVNSITGLDILPSFVIEYSTIGQLRKAFAHPKEHAAAAEASADISDFSVMSGTPESSNGSRHESSAADPDSMTKITTPDMEVAEDLVIVSAPDDEKSITPSTRVTLLQGRPSSGKQPFYLIADGTGSIATYIHLPALKSKIPVYGIDSPYLRCPSQLTSKVGIPGAAKHIVEALVKFQPQGPFSIGGFSGGSMLAYEVCRQLGMEGRTVDSLLLIDMCCPRPPGAEDKAEVGWRVYESIAAQGGLWSASESTQQHLRAVFASVAAYHPSPLPIQLRPKRTAIIWARKGLIDRCSGDSELMALLRKSNIPTEAFDGFMEDARMGAIAWGLPHKTPADLGPNGWERYVGEAYCLSVDADHLEMPMPGHVHLLHGAIEDALTYFGSC